MWAEVAGMLGNVLLSPCVTNPVSKRSPQFIDLLDGIKRCLYRLCVHMSRTDFNQERSELRNVRLSHGEDVVNIRAGDFVRESNPLKCHMEPVRRNSVEQAEVIDE